MMIMVALSDIRLLMQIISIPEMCAKGDEDVGYVALLYMLTGYSNLGREEYRLVTL